jgi:beta-galactosidase/beta-glucuronidase
LNGIWEFAEDPGYAAITDRMLATPFGQRILVPFVPESALSGIGKVDGIETVWYRREVEIAPAWYGKTLLLHFQGVDHDATVWVNGTEVVRHRGAWSPFTAELAPISSADESRLTIVVRARDPKWGPAARGKQADGYAQHSTGIWQTVWLEPVPQTYMLRPRITPDVANGTFHVEVGIYGPRRGFSLRARLSDSSGDVTVAEVDVNQDFAARLILPIPSERQRLWSPQDPFLYDISLDLIDQSGEVVDNARSYAGLRGITIDGKAVLLNGVPVFQRLALDFGHYPDGILTAPSEEALVRDVEIGLAAGFNGSRLHEKVFEERFLYHCDRLGYLVWGEFGDWGAGTDGPQSNQPTASFITQWLEVLERDYSHPSIIGWCPLNETVETLGDRITVLDDVTRGMFLATKAFDQTRPVLDTSGFSHRVPESDIYDSHNYEQDPAQFARDMAGIAAGMPFISGGGGDPAPIQYPWLPRTPWSIPYRGQPYFCSEFGGILWNDDPGNENEIWSFPGAAPKSIEEFYQRFEALVSTLLDNEYMFGYAFTKLTDLYGSKHGIYRFDRTPKFDIERIRRIQTRPAAIEKTGAA